MSSPDTKSKQRSWSDLGPRLMSALVLLPVTALALFLGGIWFAALVGVVFAGAYREWEIMVGGKTLGYFSLVLVGLVGVSAIVFPIYGPIGSLITGGITILLSFVFPGNSRFWRAGGLGYVCLVIIAVLSMRGTAGMGIVAGVFLAVSVWMTDSAAFFTGRQVGGAKLSPDISPSKTWSGALGGLAMGTIGGTLVWAVATPSPWWIGAALAALLSVSGQIGDLLESAVKRHFRVKDSGDLIPGHGGLMDRLDSLALAALVLFAVGFLHGGDAGLVASAFLIW